ncbi:MAG: hypothetical protein ISR76_09100 [Planctomycetes bacterium]|nr:hypothetical protein [Planctomycetota bacterium]MBL7009142.1 hypothetical protein [Planctomycetota bacterium]
MSRAQPGQVRIEGLLEGPTSSWSPTADALADALGRAGAPRDCLSAVIDGGRGSLESSPAVFPRGQFSSDPAEALGLALELLLSETHGGRPEEWFSTLRVTEYRDRDQRESLLQVTVEGVRIVARETEWQPPPRPRWTAVLRRQWKVGLLLLGAGVLLGVKERDQVGQFLRRVSGLVFGSALEVPEDFAAEPGAFREWIRFAGVRSSGGELVVVLEATESFPRLPADLDALRATASLERRAALNAIENGRARLRVTLLEGFELEDEAIDLQPLRRDVTVEIRIDAGHLAGTRLAKVELLP